MKSRKKMARVRYDDGKESGTEKYVLEIWSEADGCWNEIKASRFVADAKHPEAGAEFIYYTLLQEVIHLARGGYEVDI